MVVWSWREVNGFEIYFEDRVNVLMNWIRAEKKDKYDW